MTLTVVLMGLVFSTVVLFNFGGLKYSVCHYALVN